MVSYNYISMRGHFTCPVGGQNKIAYKIMRQAGRAVHENVWPYCITFNRLLDKLLGQHASVNVGVKLHQKQTFTSKTNSIFILVKHNTTSRLLTQNVLSD